MLERIEIKDYRGIKHLVLEDLGKINLLVGKNGVGKTDVLLHIKDNNEQG